MGTVITFYSYKGGVGRTFALANVASLLAMNGKKILCIDWDLEAPGLGYYFNKYLPTKQQKGVVELISDIQHSSQINWKNYISSVQLAGEFTGEFDFISAGVQNDNYTRRMQALNWDDLFKDHKMGEILEQLREEWTKIYDFVLIDSRAGITDIGGICTIQMPDILFTFATANEQSIEGTKSTIDKILNARTEMPYPRAFLNVVPILTRVDRNESYLQEKWENIFIERTEDVYGEWIQIGADSGDLLKRVYIPYYPKYSYGEELPVLTDARKTESINDYFENLTALIIHGLADTSDFINDRDKYVSSALKITKAIVPSFNQNISVGISDEEGNKEVGYLDLILEGKENFASANNLIGSITRAQNSVNQSMTNATIKLNKVLADSPKKDHFLLAKEILDELANDLDGRFQGMDRSITYLKTDLENALDYYRKGYDLLFQSLNGIQSEYLDNKEQIEELINFRDSLVGFMDSLKLLKDNFTILKDSFVSMPKATKRFVEVQKTGSHVMESLIEVAATSIKQSEIFLSYLNIKIAFNTEHITTT